MFWLIQQQTQNYSQVLNLVLSHLFKDDEPDFRTATLEEQERQTYPRHCESQTRCRVPSGMFHFLEHR